MSNTENIRQSLPPKPSTKRDLASNSYNILSFKTESNKTVFSFLFSKIIFSEDYLTEFEITALFLSYEKMVIKINQDKGTWQKYSYLTFLLRHIIQSLEPLIRMDPKDRFIQMEGIRTLVTGFSHIISRRFYFRKKGELVKLYELWVATRMKKKFAAKAFIGKGYGDKGTAKNLSLDGSPDWKEVAMDARNTDIVTCLGDKVESYFESLRSHQRQLYGSQQIV